jgi:REP element-mobilizing transposase RayT
MAMHTYSAVYIHVIFATWSRCPFLDATTRPQLHAYIAGIARNLGFADVYVGGVEDHIHLFGRFHPACSLSDVIGQLKKSSGDWLRERVPMFRWQQGFGAFSVSPDRIRFVQRYVQRQEKHHAKRTFQQELAELCAELGIGIDDLEIM